VPHDPLQDLGGHARGVAAAETPAQGPHGHLHAGLAGELDDPVRDGIDGTLVPVPRVEETEHLPAVPGQSFKRLPQLRVESVNADQEVQRS